MTVEEIGSELEHLERVGMYPWGDFQKCGTCHAPLGQPCRALSGRIVGGRPDGVSVALERAHAHRRRRSGR